MEKRDDPEIFLKVSDILSRFSKGDRPIGENSELVNDLGLDSLQVMEVVNDLEDAFDISFPLNNLAEVRTVKDLVQEIQKLVGAE